ncbi:DUF2789 family protein [Parashewanella tropica]|uniref:DUF2789 family protein n=1 Tax=Parashewanella tropica TaxID=2547970 RepID=UPI00105A3E54|nr:DUF2789 family protein [Parashewanella tropica]
MEAPIHTLSSLFEQLGLEGSQFAIDGFIHRNSPIPQNVELAKAKCWNQSQASMLSEMLSNDADWEPIVDQLSVLMHK